MPGLSRTQGAACGCRERSVRDLSLATDRRSEPDPRCHRALPQASVAQRAGFPARRPRQGSASSGHDLGPERHRGQLRHLPLAESVHHLSRECPRVARDSRAGARRTDTDLRGLAAGAAEPFGGRLVARAWTGGTAIGRDVRELSHTRELHELPRRRAVARDCGAPGRRSGTRSGRAVVTRETVESHSGLQGTARGGGKRTPDDMRKLSRARELHELPCRGVAARRGSDATRRHRTRGGPAMGTRKAVEPHAGIQGGTRPHGKRQPPDVRDLPREIDVSRVSPP